MNEKYDNKLEARDKIVKRIVLVLRYISVVLVTVGLFALSVSATDKYDSRFFILFIAAVASVSLFWPVYLIWIYSFIKSFRKHTKSDKILFWCHWGDILLFVSAVILASKPTFHCNADIMAEHCELYGSEMKHILSETRAILPDSTSLWIEFGEDYNPAKYPKLNIEQQHELRHSLENVGCIGLEIYGEQKDYSSIRFRRVGMDMYTFRILEKPLTAEQRDSINRIINLIVYNDTIVFEHGVGVCGSLCFPGKEEFLEKLNKSQKDSL